MMSLPCPCGKKLKVKEDLAGKRIKCPGCGGLLTVPSANGTPQPAEKQVSKNKSEEPPPRKKKKKKKKEDELTRRQRVDREYEEWLERSRFRKRILRGVAFIACGLAIIAGSVYLLVLHSEELRPIYSIGMLILGILAVGKGAFGLLFGQFFGEDE